MDQEQFLKPPQNLRDNITAEPRTQLEADEIQKSPLNMSHKHPVPQKATAMTRDQLLDRTEDLGTARSLEPLENRLTIHDFMKMQELFMVSFHVNWEAVHVLLKYNLVHHCDRKGCGTERLMGY